MSLASCKIEFIAFGKIERIYHSFKSLFRVLKVGGAMGIRPKIELASARLGYFVGAQGGLIRCIRHRGIKLYSYTYARRPFKEVVKIAVCYRIYDIVKRALAFSAEKSAGKVSKADLMKGHIGAQQSVASLHIIICALLWRGHNLLYRKT